MIWQSMLLKGTCVRYDKLLALIIVSVRKEDIISVSDEESLGVLLLCDDLVYAVEYYIGDDA